MDRLAAHGGAVLKRPAFDPLWSDEVKALYRHDVQEIWDQSIAPHVWNQYHNQLDTYLAVVEDAAQGPKAILDVGCAQGTLALLLAERGHFVVAADLRPEFLDYARTRHTTGDIRFIAANALELDLGETFDLIFANQIIEHLVYPGRLVARLKAMLNAGGRLVVTTPNGDYIKNTLPSFSELGEVSQYDDRQFTADGDGHFFAYREEELRSIFVGQGFREVEVHFFESPFISGHLKVRYLHRLAPTPLLRLADRALLAAPSGKRFAHQLMVIGSV